jgi:glycosyltransferase involved in cell wall biosynthesis
LDACGRPVFEAAFSRVPSIVAVSDPKPDTIIDGETGICIPPRDPKALADAVEYFCTQPSEVERMGEAAYRLAMENFDIAANASKMLAIYRHLVRSPSAIAMADAAIEDAVQN